MSETEAREFSTPFAHEELARFYDEWPGGLDEVEASVSGWREKAKRLKLERDEAREALLKVLPYMRVDTPNACAAFGNARAILAKVKP